MPGTWIEAGEDDGGAEADREQIAPDGGASHSEGYESGESQRGRSRAVAANGRVAPAVTHGEDNEGDGNNYDYFFPRDRDVYLVALEGVAALDPSDSGSSTISRPTSHDRRSPSPRELQPSQPFTRRNAVTSTDILQLFSEGEDGRLAYRVVASHEWS